LVISAAALAQSASAGPQVEAAPALLPPPFVAPPVGDEPPLVVLAPLTPPVPAPWLLLPATLAEPPVVLPVPPLAGGEVVPLLLLHAQNSVPSADAKTVMLIALFIGDAFCGETRKFRKERVRMNRKLGTFD